MSRRFFKTSVAIIGGIVLAGLAGCGDGVPTELTSEDLAPSFSAHAERSGLNQSLAAARAATARYQRLEAAMDAGYGPITECFVDPAGGAAMGFHYGNPDLIGDGGAIDVAEPEVLVYAPWRNGKLRLVAVEYLILEGDWTDAEAPEMLGHEFHFVEDAGVWGFHAWIWQHNPRGIFADYNPRVSCDGAD
jgi:hypothetical protein